MESKRAREQEWENVRENNRGRESDEREKLNSRGIQILLTNIHIK